MNSNFIQVIAINYKQIAAPFCQVASLNCKLFCGVSNPCICANYLYVGLGLLLPTGWRLRGGERDLLRLLLLDGLLSLLRCTGGGLRLRPRAGGSGAL